MTKKNGCVIICFDDTVFAKRSLMLQGKVQHGIRIPFSSRSHRQTIAQTASIKAVSNARQRQREMSGERPSRSSFARKGPCSDAENVIFGLKKALTELGLFSITIPSSAARFMGSSLSYRLPEREWRALRSVKDDAHDTLVFSMMVSMHDGRTQRNTDKSLLLGLGHLLLPLELIGERMFIREACDLIRMLPCFGLDRSMDRASEYGVMFAYEGEGAKSSPEFERLLDLYREKSEGFLREHGISSEEDLAEFIQAYGQSCGLLNSTSARALQNPGLAHSIARQAMDSGLRLDAL